MSYLITPATEAHLAALQHRLRAEDAQEITCLGITIGQALWGSWGEALISKAAVVNGQVAAVWGCGGSALGGVGIPWLLTAPEIETIPVSFVKEARTETAAMARLFPRLENYVADSYTRAKRFLSVIGFTLDPEAVSVRGAGFRRFWMERE